MHMYTYKEEKNIKENQKSINVHFKLFSDFIIIIFIRFNHIHSYYILLIKIMK